MLLVVASHVLGVPRGGYVGVDVFFVLSGFLITGLLVREQRHSGRISLREFYARRVRRLLPAAVLVLAASNLAALAVFTGERAGQALRDAVWAALFAANLRFSALGTDYFDQTRPVSPVQHYWSLAVEEQFYLVWPWLLLALLVLTRRRLRIVLALLLALTGASLAWSVLTTASNPTAAYFSTPARAWELGVGALLALAAHARVLPRLDRRMAAALAWVGLAGIALAAWRYDEQTAFPGTAALLPVLATALVLLAGAPGAQPVVCNPLLVNPAAAYLGRISYSLYLWHWPVLVAASALLAPGPTRTAAVLAVAGAACVLSHHLVEEPVRRSQWLSRRPERAARTARRPLRSRQSPVRAGLVGLGVTGALLAGWVVPAMAIYQTPPDPVALPSVAPLGVESPAGLQTALASALRTTSWPPLNPPLLGLARRGAPEWIVDRCDNVNSGNLATCSYGSPAAPRLAVLVGDSMAISYLPGLRATLEPRGWRIQVLTRNQCPNPLSGFWRERPSELFTSCDAHKQWMLEQVRRLRPDLVLASNSITFVDHQQGEPTGQARFDQWQAGLTDLLHQLVAVSGRVVVLGPPPRAGNLQSCVTRVSTPADCTEPITADWRSLRAAERAAARSADATYVDPESWFCVDGRCPAVVGDTPVYTDGRHLTQAYAQRLAPQLRAGLALTAG